MNNSTKRNELIVFFDDECPMCRREVQWIQSQEGNSAIDFLPLKLECNELQSHGISEDAARKRIHAVNANGSVIKGVEVFRVIYTQLGYHKLVQISRLPVVRNILDLAYMLFASLRKPIGRILHMLGMR